MSIHYSKTTTKFLVGSSLNMLEREMERLVVINKKQYDFYNFFQFTDVRGRQKFAAAYREEIMFKTETLTKDKK